MKTETRELMDKIKLIICAEEGIHPDIVFTHTRQKAIKEARQIIAYFCRKYIKGPDGKEISYQIIGDFIGLDHATVMHTCRTLEGWISTDKCFREKMERYDKKAKDYSGMYSLDVSLLLADKIKSQMVAIKKDIALLESITRVLIPAEN